MIILKSYSDYHGCGREGIRENRLENPFSLNLQNNLNNGNGMGGSHSPCKAGKEFLQYVFHN